MFILFFYETNIYSDCSVVARIRPSGSFNFNYIIIIFYLFNNCTVATYCMRLFVVFLNIFVCF